MEVHSEGLSPLGPSPAAPSAISAPALHLPADLQRHILQLLLEPAGAELLPLREVAQRLAALQATCRASAPALGSCACACC